MKRKGQIAGVDVLVASVIFIFIFVALRGVWLNNISTAENTANATEMQLLATQSLDVLLKTPGYPTNWSPSSIDSNTIIGLADKPLVINSKKLSDFNSLCQIVNGVDTNYEIVKGLLGLGKYEYKFELNSYSSSDENFSCGKTIRSTGAIAAVKRVVYFGGRADVTFTVFK